MKIILTPEEYFKKASGAGVNVFDIILMMTEYARYVQRITAHETVEAIERLRDPESKNAPLTLVIMELIKDIAI